MNTGAHVAVAAALPTGAGTREAWLLGAALPDLATYVQLRLLGTTPDPGVRAGITFHYRTDDAFHRHPWFLGHQRRLIDALVAAGFARGPALACGHVGVELLLDGILLADSAAYEANRTAFGAIAGLRDALEPLVEAKHRDRWVAHLDRLATWTGPADLDDPAAIASRLWRVVADRPRLAFAAVQKRPLARALADLQPSVAATAEGFVAELLAELADDELATDGLVS